MTNIPLSDSQSKKIKVICIAPTASDSLLTSIKQLFSLKPAGWKISVDLILERPTTSLNQLIASLGLAITVIPVTSVRQLQKAANERAKDNQDEFAATLWIDARSTLVSDAFSRLESFSLKYPNAVLIGKFSSGSPVTADAQSLDSQAMAQARTVALQSLPFDVDQFERNFVFVPDSVAKKVGQPVGLLNERLNYRWFVRRARKAGSRCMEMPGNFGALN